METPDYSNYSIDELYDVYYKIDRNKYPERFEIIVRLIQEKGKQQKEIYQSEKFFDTNKIKEEKQITYSYTNSESRLIRLKLIDSKIEYSENNKLNEIILTEIKKVKLFPPCTISNYKYLCEIALEDGNIYRIYNESWQKFKKNIKQNEEYVNFIANLHYKLCRYPKIEYKYGDSFSFYSTVLFSPILIIFVFLSVIGSIAIRAGILFCLLFIWMGYLAILNIKCGRTKGYNVLLIPQKALPTFGNIA